MSGKIPFLVLSAVAFSAFAIAAPADPTITSPAILPRQNGDRFIGWVQSSGKWYSEACNSGLTWFQEGRYGQCCPASLTRCPAPTACVSGSMIYPLPALSKTTTIGCIENFGNASYSICNTAFIFENMQDSNPKTDIVCGEESVNWSYYRQVPASITEAATRAPFSIPNPVTTAVGSLGTTNSGKKGGSKAWIAGAVIGPLLGLALVGVAVFFLLRRRKNKSKVSQQGGAAMAINPAQPPAGVAGYTDAKPQFVQQQQPAYTPDPYANQGAFAAQQGYNNAPISPAPQYNNPVVSPAPQYNNPAVSPAPQYNNTPVSPITQYNTSPAPYNASVSPPPQQGFYGNDVKHAHTAAPMNGAAELGGSTNNTAPATSAPAHQAAELGGQSQQQQGGGGLFGPSELPSNAANTRPNA
ncbi:hypothetical protein CC86DRAFT_469810 [Ophiobolus disseminans]|uniref:Mid2 domain-containing protein n=1 Tax=Ophiobolus disseminans TaxID=1469910 RepID=A0A6A6ZMZ6_9PLEO|nr:hypothetical protein CC86DRAFT_469810 [Ophiobolus disseminans]